MGWEGRGGELVAPPTYETLSVNAHTPLHRYIYIYIYIYIYAFFFSITDCSDSWKNGSQVYGDKRH